MYGPVRTVVWEGRSRKAPPYPDLWTQSGHEHLKAGRRLFARFETTNAGCAQAKLPKPSNRIAQADKTFPVRLWDFAVVIVLDNGPIHVSKATTAALATRAHRLTVEWLPKYAPELNDIEVVWHDLKAHHLAHQTFTDAEALDRTIHVAVTSLNIERNVDPLVKQRISA